MQNQDNLESKSIGLGWSPQKIIMASSRNISVSVFCRESGGEDCGLCLSLPTSHNCGWCSTVGVCTTLNQCKLDPFTTQVRCNYTSACKLGWAQIEKVLLNFPRHIQAGAGGPPEHFEPKQGSVPSIPVYSTASTVLASVYWRPIFQGRQIGSKLKFYYPNRPLGVQKKYQN